MVHIYPWFTFHLPLFLGKPMHWNKLNLEREGLHHILGRLTKAKTFLSDARTLSAIMFRLFHVYIFSITDNVFRLPFNLRERLTMCRHPLYRYLIRGFCIPA